MGRRKKLPLLENVEISDIGAKGKAIARVDNFVTFISNGLPGDVVDLQVTRRKKSYQEGRVVKFHRYSEKRSDAFCKHFGTCGGCRWQDLKYAEQLHYKQKEVAETLERVGQLELPPIHPIMASEKETHYRNKLEYTFSNRRWLTNEEIQSEDEIADRNALGFHKPGMFDKVIDLEECFLQPEPSNSIRQAVREFARENGLSFFDLRNRGGLLRNLLIRNTLSGEVMVIVVFYEEDEEPRTALLDHLREKFPEITSLMYCINRKANDTIADQEILLHSGKDHILEKMEDLQFKIGPKSFFQTNSNQALELYRKVREYASLTGNECVYDLYTGTGTIGLFLADKAGKVVGIEYVEEAIHDARVNAELNGIGNARFFSGDIKDVLSREFIDSEGHPDVLVCDPPRAGMHQNVVDQIMYALPGRIIYVSCNPATQARDLQLLNEKYRIVEVQPVDMFPHTYHVENIVLLECLFG
ncbi:MAG: 23S rRNA (uracil(1939)-C(5))-methyltransferase RlmD [Bacteroidales bacterium]|nr:23S rRNA (uracil(1939)-C(5))-methyltransferase RlmD [Bacteroidales bacterium]